MKKLLKITIAIIIIAATSFILFLNAYAVKQRYL